MNILITGAAGFYGVNLIERILGENETSRIYCVDNFSSPLLLRNPFTIFKKNKKQLKIIRKDFSELSAGQIDKMKLDAVVHLAAFISIPESMANPRKYFINNEYGTFKFTQNLLHTKSKPVLIYASSPEVYGNPKYTPMDEEHPLHPRSMYATTKLAAEKHCMGLHEWHDYPVTVIRNFNTFGKVQNLGNYGAAVPSFIKAALHGKDIIVHGNGKQTRDFLYIKDAIEAYILVLNNFEKCKGEIFNIGSGRQISIIEMAKKIIELNNSKSSIVFTEARKGDLNALQADTTKIRKYLGWQPKYEFDEALKETNEWYKNVFGVK